MCKSLSISLLFSSWWCLIFSSVSTLQDPPNLSPGVFYEEESGQILYEATAPIIYQFQIPVWENFLGLEIQNCRNTTGYTDYCHIFDIFESISKDIQSATTPGSFSFPEETTQSTWGLKCNYLSQHFSSLRVDLSIVQKYLDFLRSCSKGVILEEELNTEYSSKPFTDRFENIKQIFESDFLGQLEPDGDPVLRSTVGLNLYDNLLSTGFSSFMAEAIRWNSAITTCKSGQIPDSLLTPAMFLDSLRKLNETASTKGWTFVIQPIAQFLPLYFKAPIADCTFSGDKFIIRVLIPVTKSNRQWIHISAQSIPFYKQISSGGPELVYTTEETLDGKEPFFYEKVSKRLFKAKDCDTSRPGFCRLPEFWDRTLVTSGSCVWSVLQDNGTDVPRNVCYGMGRQDIRALMVIPLVVKRGTDTYYITGVPEMTLVVKCSEFDGSDTTHEFQFPQVQGSLEVRLPCFCQIITGGVEYDAEAPCHVLSDQLSVTEVWHQDFQPELC